LHGDTGSHVLAVASHRQRERQGGDSILGSTAIFGVCRYGNYTEGGREVPDHSDRPAYGQDLEETTLHFDNETRTVSLGQSRQEEDLEAMKEALLQFLQGQEAPAHRSRDSRGVRGKEVPQG